MTSSPITNSATDQFVDAVTSQAVEIAKDVAVPAAKIAAVHFFRSRAKSIAIVLVAASVLAVLAKRMKADSRSDDASITNDAEQA